MTRERGGRCLRGRRRARRRIAAALAGAIGAIGIAELGLRAFDYGPTHVNPLRAFHDTDPVLGHRGRRGYSGRFTQLPDFDVVIANDARGFRRHERRVDPSLARHKLCVFGDSFTWGYGAGQGQVFTDVLVELAPHLDVRNLGINATGTSTQLALWESEVAATVGAGDHVLVMFFQNDFSDNVDPDRVHGELQGDMVLTRPPVRPLASPFGQWFKDNCYLFNAVSCACDTWKLQRRRAEEAAHVPGSVAVGGDLVRIAAHYLAAFRDATRARGAQFTVAYVPGQAEVGEAPNHSEQLLGNDRAYRAAFFTLARDLALDVIDLLPALLAARSAEPGVRLTFPLNCHWTARGHEVVARVLAAEFAAR